jgi:hypothetical protein
MAPGTKSYMGLAVPLHGESEIRQILSTVDILTLEQAAQNSNADFLVLRRSVGTELFKVGSAGNVAMAGSFVLDGGIVLGATKRIRFSAAATTKPSTGLTKGELMIIWHGSIPRIAICTSTGGDILKYRALKTKTLGRLT